jgi:hypothetical protein
MSASGAAISESHDRIAWARHAAAIGVPAGLTLHVVIIGVLGPLELEPRPGRRAPPPGHLRGPRRCRSVAARHARRRRDARPDEGEGIATGQLPTGSAHCGAHPVRLEELLQRLQGEFTQLEVDLGGPVRRAVSGGHDDGNPLGHEPAGGEPHEQGRRLVEPLGVVDAHEHGLLLGEEREQGQQAQADGDRRRSRVDYLEGQSRPQRRPLCLHRRSRYVRHGPPSETSPAWGRLSSP